MFLPRIILGNLILRVPESAYFTSLRKQKTLNQEELSYVGYGFFLLCPLFLHVFYYIKKPLF